VIQSGDAPRPGFSSQGVIAFTILSGPRFNTSDMIRVLVTVVIWQKPPIP
jgi:hypothetical protein